jgi:hypothetical protein
MNKCCACPNSYAEADFTRKGKVFKSCNLCSERLKKKYAEGEIPLLAKDDQRMYNQLYYIKNRSKLLSKNTDYRHAHLDDKYVCECGKTVKYNNNQHKFSIKHILAVECIAKRKDLVS